MEPTVVLQLAALIDSRFDSLRDEIRASARSVRKEMRFLAAGVGTVMVTGFLYLNASLTDLSVALARVETELALLLERVPIQ